MDEPSGDLPGSPLGLFLFESVDEFDGGEEANALVVVFDGLDAERRGDVGLAGAGSSDEDDVVGVRDERAAMELADEIRACSAGKSSSQSGSNRMSASRTSASAICSPPRRAAVGDGRPAGEACRSRRLRDLSAAPGRRLEAVRPVEGRTAADGRRFDVQDPDLADALHAVGRRDRVPGPRPAVVHAVPEARAGGHCAGRDDDLALPRAADPGRRDRGPLRRVRRLSARQRLSGDVGPV